jgi:hypothetical protein
MGHDHIKRLAHQVWLSSGVITLTRNEGKNRV